MDLQASVQDLHLISCSKRPLFGGRIHIVHYSFKSTKCSLIGVLTSNLNKIQGIEISEIFNDHIVQGLHILLQNLQPIFYKVKGAGFSKR